jgi:hypothetical protein
LCWSIPTVEICSGQLECPFATLFDDDECQQTLESLMGTLKAAKKRGIITFEGQLLLKGSHDKVRVSRLTALFHLSGSLLGSSLNHQVPIFVLKEDWTAGP